MFEKMPSVAVRRDLVAGVFCEVLAKSRKKVAKVHYAQSSGVARWWKFLATGGDVSFKEWLDRDLGMVRVGGKGSGLEALGFCELYCLRLWSSGFTLPLASSVGYFGFARVFS